MQVEKGVEEEEGAATHITVQCLGSDELRGRLCLADETVVWNRHNMTGPSFEAFAGSESSEVSWRDSLR